MMDMLGYRTMYIHCMWTPLVDVSSCILLLWLLFLLLAFLRVIPSCAGPGQSPSQLLVDRARCL